MTMVGDVEPESDALSWDASYAIARELKRLHPDVDLTDVSLEMIFRWTMALPEFDDDPELANESVLMAIYREWYEELDPL